MSTGVFSKLSKAELDELFAEAQDVEYSKGAMIFWEGENSSALYYIVSGAVTVRVKGVYGRDLRLARLGSNEVFGEMSALDGLPRSATVVAMEQTKVKMLSRESFLRMMSTNPFVAQLVMQGLSARLRAADKHLRRAYARFRPRSIISTTG